MVKIVAEITANHLGNVDRCLDMMDKALAAGADYVKVQRRDPDTFYTTEKLESPFSSPFGSTFGDYRRGLELSYRDFDRIDANFSGVWFASVLDWPSYQSLKPFDPPFMKLPSTISRHKDFITDVAEDWDHSLVMSLGMTDRDYFWTAVDLLVEHEERINQKGIYEEESYLLQCTSAYPAPLNELNLGLIQQIDFHPEPIYAGYSSHDTGYLGCQLAVAAGAQMIEKHVTLPGAEWVERNDVAVSLEGGYFWNFCHAVRVAEEAMGSGTPHVTASENHKYS